MSSGSVTERRGVASFGVRPLRHTWTMERRRMDAALLVLLVGHLATALEVPLDRKDHTAGNVHFGLNHSFQVTSI